MFKFLACAAAVAGLALTLNATASAQPAEPAVPVRVAEGDQRVTPASARGYWIRVEGDRVHLRTTDPGDDASVYTGQISVDTHITNLEVIRNEESDFAFADRDTIDFRLVTANHVDGVSFVAENFSRITFRLYRNGHLISVEQIHLGAGGHPTGNPFSLFR